jgi:hypothetical protein
MLARFAHRRCEGTPVIGFQLDASQVIGQPMGIATRSVYRDEAGMGNAILHQFIGLVPVIHPFDTGGQISARFGDCQRFHSENVSRSGMRVKHDC